jgi:hypothetical protein
MSSIGNQSSVYLITAYGLSRYKLLLQPIIKE